LDRKEVEGQHHSKQPPQSWACPNNKENANHMGVSKNNGTPKSSILIGFSIINHPFWGKTHYFWKHPYDHNFLNQPIKNHKNLFFSLKNVVQY